MIAKVEGCRVVLLIKEDQHAKRMAIVASDVDVVSTKQGSNTSGARFYALDCVRAMAMLLGVVFHAIFFGRPRGLALTSSPAEEFMHWIHCFRMPLFFLISGFFCHMMYEKYGWSRYLARRWWRIGAPFLLVLFALAGFHQLIKSMAVSSQAQGSIPYTAPCPMADYLFGSFGRELGLKQLWFLWYLIVFATVAPIAAGIAGWFSTLIGSEKADRLGSRVLRLGLLPLALGLLTIPSLLVIPVHNSWSLGLAAGFFWVVPDVFFQYQPDWPFYFTYFLFGWWLFRMAARLEDVARVWIPCFTFGLLAYACATMLSKTYVARMELPHYELIRLSAYTLYALGGAYLSYGVLGFFQRYVNRPTAVGLYLAETAFWVYLVHQQILTGLVLRLLNPLKLDSSIQALVATAVTMAIALVGYELVVRPTPLVILFGPSRSKKSINPLPLADGNKPSVS